MGVHILLSMTHREAAVFDDACTVPTPCLLLPAFSQHEMKSSRPTPSRGSILMRFKSLELPQFLLHASKFAF